MLNLRSEDFHESEQIHSSNLMQSWLSHFPTAQARREEAERLAQMVQSELDTLGLSAAEINAYLGRRLA